MFFCAEIKSRARTQPKGWRSENACVFLRYAPCLTLQTLCVALLFILDLHYVEQPYSIPPQKTHTSTVCVFFVPRLSQGQEPGQNIIACDNAISKMLFMTRQCCPGNRECCPKRGFYETECGKTASCRRGTICRNFPCLQVARYQGRFPPVMPQSQCRQARR